MTIGAQNGFQLETSAPGTLGVSGVLNFDTAAAALLAIQAGLACVLAAVAAADRHGQVLRVIHMPAGMQALATVCEVDQLLR